MDQPQREPGSNASENNGQNQVDHVDHLQQLNEVRPKQQKAQQLQLPPPDQNVHDFTINQATPTLLTDTETAAELSPNVNVRPRANKEDRMIDLDSRAENKQQDRTMVSGRGLAMAGLISSIISLFVLPIFLGLVGIVLGFVGMRGGRRTIGMWAIGIGVVSILVSILFTPFMVR